MKKNEYLHSLIYQTPFDEIGFNPYYNTIQSAMDTPLKVEGREVINLAANNYLGIANHPLMRQRMKEAIDQYGVSMCGTPIATGSTELIKELQRQTATFLKQEDALVYPSCYQANLGVFQVLSNQDDILIVDHGSHSSLLNGCWLSKAFFRPFPHNSTKRLAEILARSQDYRMRFIVLEGLYSTEGDYPPLAEIAELAEKYQAFVVVDDAHGIGVLGETGRGVIEQCQVFDRVDLITGSYGKAFGAFGGFISGKKQILDYFRYDSSMLIYSTALPPAVTAAALASLEIVDKHPELIKRTWQYANQLRKGLLEMGYKLTNSKAPLVSVLFKSTPQTVMATKILFSKGVMGTPFVAPSVPAKYPRIRLIPGANLKEEHIEKALVAFKELKDELD